MILDSKQTYFDAEGNRLAGGRLRFYLWGTTTPTIVYADQEHNTPVGGSVALTSAGWTPFELHSDEDLDVRADKFIGLDEFGLEIYQEVKAFRYIPAGSVGTSTTASMAIVETIADLRALSTSFGSATVLGYYAAGDCPVRTYTVKTSAATENGGTIINSTFDPSKKWSWTPDCDEIDNRIFGVIANPDTTVNSQLASYLGYCEMRGATAKFVGGTYRLTPGSLASAAAISVAAGTLLSCQGGTYTLTLSNPALRIVDTFAGEGLNLLLAGPSWERTVLPITAFSSTSYSEGTGHFNLHIPADGLYAFPSGQVYSEISVAEGVTASLTVTAEVHVGKITGPGKIHYNTSTTLHVGELRTSCLANMSGYAMARAGIVYVDSAVVLPPGCLLTCAIIDAGGTLEAGPVTQGGMHSTIRGSLDCRPGFLRGAAGFDMEGEIDIEKFSDVDGAVASWLCSPGSYPELNLMGAQTSLRITRSGTLRNGTIAGFNVDYARMYDIASEGPAIANSLIADGCVITTASYNVSGGNLRRCSINPIGLRDPDPELSGHIIEDTSVGYPWVKVTGGGATFRNVSATNVKLIPSGASFGNFSWVGGSCSQVLFDASVATTTGPYVAYNVTITHLVGLSAASSTNGSTKKWASSGHYNIKIGDNEGGRRTYGELDVPITHTGSYYGDWRGHIGYLDKLFRFSQDETALVAWSARAYKADELGWHFETMTTTTVDRTKNGEFHLWSQRFSTLEGKTPDHAHITFRVYY